MNQQHNKSNDKEQKDEILKPDPETLNTSDPQEEMEGPVSSIMQNIKEGMEEEDGTKNEEEEE